MAECGYRGKPLLSLIEEPQNIPIIDYRHKQKEDETRQYLDTDVIYNRPREVFWVDDKSKVIGLTYKEYDKSCDSLRYGFHPHYQDNRIFRLNRSLEPSSFNQIARDSQRFKLLYKK